MIRLLSRILLPLEILSLLISVVAFLLTQMELLMIGMSFLAAVYFLNAYVPPAASEKAGDEKAGFIDLLTTIIAPKLGWIAASVTVIGGLFRMLHLAGAGEMLMIGVLVLMIVTIVMGISAVTGSRTARVTPVLYRIVPVCLFGVYLLFNYPA